MSSWFLLILSILTAAILFRKYLRVYYLVFKLPGPCFLPFAIVGIRKLIKKRKNVYSILMEIVSSYPSVFRMPLGPYIQIVTSRPQDIEIIFNSCLDKGVLYDTFRDVSGNSILVANTKEWHKNRKLIINSFNQKLVNSFADIFMKDAKNLVRNFQVVYGTKNKDLMTTVWIYTLRDSFKTLTDSDPDDNVLQELIDLLKRYEKIYLERLYTPWLNIRAIWIKSTLFNELAILNKQADNIFRNVIYAARNVNMDSVITDPLKKLLFINNLFSGCQNGLINDHEILSESKLMLTVSSETTAATISFVLIALGMYPTIQDKVYEEVISALNDGKELSIEGIKQLQYLQRVIKETLRMKPAAPIISRKLDKDIFSEPFIFPAGCDVMVPIEHLHKNPEIWKDPLKFNPDRFLPDEVEKRHRCAYIPFSHGLRNCIGIKYAMLATSCMVAEIVRNFRIKTFRPKEFEDVEVEYTIVSAPKNYSVEFINRQ